MQACTQSALMSPGLPLNNLLGFSSFRSFSLTLNGSKVPLVRSGISVAQANQCSCRLQAHETKNHIQFRSRKFSSTPLANLSIYHRTLQKKIPNRSHFLSFQFSPFAQRKYGAKVESFCQRYVDHPHALKNCMFFTICAKERLGGPFVKDTWNNSHVLMCIVIFLSFCRNTCNFFLFIEEEEERVFNVDTGISRERTLPGSLLSIKKTTKFTVYLQEERKNNKNGTKKRIKNE